MNSPYRLAPLFWATGLLVGGLLLLIFNFGWLTEYQPLAQGLLALALTAAGVTAFVMYIRTPSNWARLMLAWTMLALAATTLINLYATPDRTVAAAVLLIGLMAAFLHVYLSDRMVNWWALLVGGFLLVVGLVSILNYLLNQTSQPVMVNGVLLAGLGSVFFLLYLLSDKSRFWWALLPGGALLLVAFVMLTADRAQSNWVINSWPSLLVLAGLAIGRQATRRLPAAKLEINQAPYLRKKVKEPSVKIMPPSKEPFPNPSSPTQPAPKETVGVLGEYSAPAPGASVEVMSDEL